MWCAATRTTTFIIVIIAVMTVKPMGLPRRAHGALLAMTVGNGVTSIGKNAFYDCNKLTEINYNATECADLSGGSNNSNYVFYNAGQSGDGITVNIGANVKKIPEYLFYPYYNDSTYSPNIVSVKFAENSVCESIGESAFAYCTNLTSINIPDSVTSIGSGAFDGTAYYNDGSKWENDVLYIGNHLIKANTSLSGAYEIESGTLTIAGSAFSDCTALTSIEIPDSVTGIGTYAFRNCTSLTSIEIPNGVTSIGSYAFRDCTALTSIDIPDSVTSIGENAFYKCTALTSVTFKNTSGWWYASSSTATSGTSISSDDLANASTAATYLKSTYYYYYWKRSES